MFTKRIVPCLDVNNERVVKDVNFMNLRDVRDPVEIAATYDRARADEPVFLDIMASSDNRRTVADIVREMAGAVFVPFAVGGSIRTVENFHMFLREGTDKIPVNSSAIDNSRLINDATNKFGRQYVVVAMDARRKADGKDWSIYKHGGCVDVRTDALERAMETDHPGAREMLLISMDCDGTRNGCDNELTSLIASYVPVPVIAPEDAGNKEYLYDALTEGGADAALAASLFHYKELEIRDLKKYLWGRGIAIRI